MIFVIDTSELHDQKRLEGNLLRLFLLAKNLTKHRVCIPAVVLAEYQRHSREAMEKSAAVIEKELKVLARYWDKLDTKLPPIDSEFQKWRTWIDERLRVAGIEVIPYPTTTHQSLADRDLARRKPFKPSGEGYRDALIWESVLDLAARSTDDIVFITSNGSDFAEGEHVHPDLTADLLTRKLENRVHLSLGLKSALEQHLNPLLPPTDQTLRAALERGPAEGIDLFRWALHDLREVCPRLRIPPTAGLDYDHVLLSTVRNVEWIQVREARRFQTGEVFVEIDLAIKAVVTPPSESTTQALAEATSSAWRLVGNVLASLLHSQSVFRMRAALTFARDRALLAADVWDFRMTGPFSLAIPSTQ